jgi:hypothetical protein
MRPTEQELLDDYLKAVDGLTINTNQKVAVQQQKQVSELIEKSEQEKSAMSKRLAESEKETEVMKKELAEVKAAVNDIVNRNLIYTLNASLEGKSYEDVHEQFAARFEKLIDDAEERIAKGKKPIFAGKGDEILYFNSEQRMELKSAIKEWRQQKQQEKKKKLQQKKHM